jgi:SAM-dependent methyltransferase
MRSWTNDEAIQRWAEFPREILDAMEPDGDFGRRHLLNPALLRMLGHVHGQRILDAGCGHGYLSRILAARRWDRAPGNTRGRGLGTGMRSLCKLAARCQIVHGGRSWLPSLMVASRPAREVVHAAPPPGPPSRRISLPDET